MKNLFIIFCFLMSICSVGAKDLLLVPYDEISDDGKIKFTDSGWSEKVKRKDSDYFVKILSEGIDAVSDFYYSDGSLAFSSGCSYEFINQGQLIGYSNDDLKFYEIIKNGDDFVRRELLEEEVKLLFPDFKIIKISDFSPLTNSLKIKNENKKMNLIILNDTDRTFANYSFSTDKADITNYNLRGLLQIKKSGLIQFSAFGEDTKNKPWFVLLVR